MILAPCFFWNYTCSRWVPCNARPGRAAKACHTRRRLPQQAFLGLSRCARLVPLPFLADLVQPVGAQLEVLAQAPQHRRLVLERLVLEGAGDVVGTLALLAVVDEM